MASGHQSNKFHNDQSIPFSLDMDLLILLVGEALQLTGGHRSEAMKDNEATEVSSSRFHNPFILPAIIVLLMVPTKMRRKGFVLFKQNTSILI